MEKILGQALKKEREMRGVSLAEIAGETRIGTRFLQALEDEEFDLFPGQFYIHYYIKNYLKACGADDTTFFNTYQNYLNTVLKKGDEPPPEQYLNKLTYIKVRKSKKILVAVLVLAILALLLYLLLGPTRWVDKFLGGMDPIAETFPAFSNTLLKHEADFCLTAPPIAALMTFDAPCWLQLWRGTEKIEQRVFRKGEVFSLNGYQLTLVIANPQGLRLELNDEEVSYFRSSPIPLKMVVNPGNLADILSR